MAKTEGKRSESAKKRKRKKNKPKNPTIRSKARSKVSEIIAKHRKNGKNMAEKG